MRYLSRFLIVIVLLCASACSGDTSAQTQGGIIATAASQGPRLSFETLPVNAANEKVVARVNGAEITFIAFERALARKQQEFEAADEFALAADTLDTLIEQLLIEQAALSLGVTISEADLMAQLDSLKADAGSPEEWENWLAQNLYNEQEVRALLRNGMITEQVINLVTQKTTGTVRQVHARHILVLTEEDAKMTLTRLQNGEDFAALAKTLSRDVTSFEQGGDLGWFGQGELLEEVLSEVAFALLPGQIAGPVATRLGYHVIQTLEFREQPITLEQQANLRQKQFENWLQALRDSASIERYGGL